MKDSKRIVFVLPIVVTNIFHMYQNYQLSFLTFKDIRINVQHVYKLFIKHFSLSLENTSLSIALCRVVNILV